MKLLAQILVILVTTGFSDHAESAPELIERTVDVGNDVSLRVVDAGELASGLTLVLIPGWSTTADIWREQINRFARSYRVISFDPRSQGKSTITTEGNTPETRAQDLHTLLDLLSVRGPVLVGWSQGVEDIAAFINRYGSGDLSGIVLVDAAISPGAEGIPARSAQQTAAQFETFATYQAHQQEYLTNMMGAIVSKPQSNDAIKELVTMGLKTPPDIGVAMRIADSFSVNRMAALKKIDCPTLIVASAKSAGLAQQQQAQAKQISRARFEKIEDAAHAVFLDQPDRFNELVMTFVVKLAPPASDPHPGPAPFMETDQPVVIPNLVEQYRTAPKNKKPRQDHKRVARAQTFWDKLRYGWIVENPRSVNKR
jgi:non-heme chloroperoxidase